MDSHQGMARVRTPSMTSFPSVASMVNAFGYRRKPKENPTWFSSQALKDVDSWFAILPGNKSSTWVQKRVKCMQFVLTFCCHACEWLHTESLPRLWLWTNQTNCSWRLRNSKTVGSNKCIQIYTTRNGLANMPTPQNFLFAKLETPDGKQWQKRDEISFRAKKELNNERIE